MSKRQMLFSSTMKSILRNVKIQLLLKQEKKNQVSCNRNCLTDVNLYLRFSLEPPEKVSSILLLSQKYTQHLTKLAPEYIKVGSTTSAKLFLSKCIRTQC